MTITINGNGTVTGVSVGGLPDGIVDTDMIAANAVTAVKRGAGAILQVVHGTYATEVESTSTSYIDSGLSQAITPLKTGSQMLVIVNQHISIYRAARDNGTALKLFQDSTERYTPAQTYQWYMDVDNANYIAWRGNITLVSKHAHGISAGTSTTYKTQFRTYTDSNSGKVEAQKNNLASNITIMEIA